MITSATIGYLTREAILTWIKDHEPISPRALARWREDHLDHISEIAFKVEIIQLAEEQLITIQPNRRIKLTEKTRKKFKEKELQERHLEQVAHDYNEWEKANARRRH